MFERSAIVSGDPFGELEEFGGDEGLGVDKVGEVAEGEVSLFSFGNAEDGAGGGAISKRNTDAAAGDDGEALRNGVVEDELGRPIDENTSGKRHGWRVKSEREMVKAYLDLLR